MDGFAAGGLGQRRVRSRLLRRGRPRLHPAAAKQATVYDRFFCSLLGSTFPNREYMHAAQSYGKRRQRHAVGDRAGLPARPRSSTRSARHRASSSQVLLQRPARRRPLGRARASPAPSRVEEYYHARAAGTLPNVSFVDPPFLTGGGDGISGDEHPARRRPHRPGVHVRRRARVHGVAAVEARRDLHRLRRVGRLLRPRQPAARAGPAQQPKLDEDFGQMGLRIPAVAALALRCASGYVDHGTYGFESILKLIRYRFGAQAADPPRRLRAQHRARFDWEGKPRLEPPDLPDPANVVDQTCTARGLGSPQPEPLPDPVPPRLRQQFAAPERPKPHDFDRCSRPATSTARVRLVKPATRRTCSASRRRCSAPTRAWREARRGARGRPAAAARRGSAPQPP